MITGAHRFHGRSSLRFVYQRGNTVRAHDFNLRYVRNPRLTGYRAAVVVSRKVSKSAVVRNRIRRRMYEIVRKASERITEPYDLVFTMFEETAAKAHHATLEAAVLKTLQKAGVFQVQNRSQHAIVIPKEKEPHT